MTEATKFRVTVPGLYKTRDDGTRKVLFVGTGNRRVFCVFGVTENENFETYRLDGRYGSNFDSSKDLVELIQADAPSAPVPTQQPTAIEESIELRRAKAAHDLLSLYGYNKYNAEQALTHVRALRTDN